MIITTKNGVKGVETTGEWEGLRGITLEEKGYNLDKNVEGNDR